MRLQLFCTLLVLVSLAACASGLVQPTPTADQTQAVRVLAVRVSDATTAGLTIVTETGKLLSDLPVPSAAKDGYDCAILKAVGTPTPASATVTATCGTVPLAASAPLETALVSLKTVTTCPALRTTVTEVLRWVNPLITSLETSTNATLRIAGISLRATFALLSSGGASCSA